MLTSFVCVPVSAPLHLELTSQPEKPVDANTLIKVQAANLQFAKWFEEWDTIFGESRKNGRARVMN